MPSCLICGSENTSSLKTKISGFMAERALDGHNRSIELIHCKSCGFAYYDLRLNLEQMNKFYSGYRNDEYQKQRQKHDCWYTKEINDAMCRNDCELINRNANSTRIFTKNLDIKKIKSVLDFGGDKGQYIPEIFNNAEKFVYEISGVKTVDRVTLINNTEDLKTKSFDLIMCNHVIEHVSDPHQTLKELKRISHKGSYLYFELPFDSPFFKNPLSNLSFLFNRYFTWKVIFKYFISLLKRGVFYPMTEHISFFTPKSAVILLEQNGYEILSNEVVKIDVDWNKPKFICILARRTDS